MARRRADEFAKDERPAPAGLSAAARAELYAIAGDWELALEFTAAFDAELELEAERIYGHMGDGATWEAALALASIRQEGPR